MSRYFAAGMIGLMGLTVTAGTTESAWNDVPATHLDRYAAQPDTGARTHLVLAPAGNEARYRVREQLAGFDFPNDAVGVTGGVTGGIVIDENGAVVPEESSFLVDLTALKSDKERRDGYVQRRTLETEQHPTAELIPTDLRELPWPLPSSGRMEFELVGDLTVRGVTRSTTWKVTAEPASGGVRGTATTSFTFEEFELTKPRVSVVLSVDDRIQLELDFHLVPAPATDH